MKTQGKTALYCRLSMDDGNDGESMSIQGQKAILAKHAADARLVDCDYYIDDGFSGTNFNRPAFKRMVADIEDGKVSTVITKDLSRLGRNYLESGAYIEVFFPKHNVRYIAVNDGVDSANAAGLDITPFKNILNEFYSRDIAKKVKTGKDIRARQGKYMGTHAPFGYIKDPADKNHLIVDERTAPIVRRIYELALMGYGNNKITKVLREERLPRPAYFKQEYFGHHIKSDEDYYEWRNHITFHILRNPLYKGGMWVHTHDKEARNSAFRGYISIHEREIIEDVHEAIVSKDDWALVQDVLNRHTRVQRSKSGYENVFRGLLKCADCDASLSLHTDARKTGEPRDMVYFICVTYRYKGVALCSNHRIDAVDLENAVLADIRKQAKRAVKDPERFIKKVLKGVGEKGVADAERMERQAAKLERDFADADRRYIKSFEDYSEGVIDKEQFSLLSGHYSKQKADAQSKIDELRKQAEKKKASHTDGQLFTQNLMEYTKIEKLDAAMLNSLIEKIVVSQATVTNGKREQEIRIHYRCGGVLN